MKAVLYEAFAETPKLTSVPDPTPEPHGVVVKVEATGICRSDWHGWMGHDPDIRLPHVPGHELAGFVEAVGKDVTRWKAGDRVTVPFVCGCGACPECHAGHQQVCRAPDPAGLHPLGIVRRICLDPSGRPQSRRASPRRWTSPPPPASAAASRPRFGPLSIRQRPRPDNGLPCMAAAGSVCPP